MSDPSAPVKTATPVSSIPQKSLFDLQPLPGAIAAQLAADDQELVAQARREATEKLNDPEAFEKFLKARESRLEILRKVAIKSTHGFDWTLYQDKEGHIVGVPRDSGLVHIRQWLGISLFNYRPVNDRGAPEARVYKDERPDGTSVDVVELMADGFCNLTGQPVYSVMHAIRSDDEFIGRERREGAKTPGSEFVSLQDMRASCRTSLDAKITRILSGLRKVPLEILEANGIKKEQCHRGRGFGTSSERGAGRVAEEGVREGVAKLKEELLRVTGGDAAAVRDLTVEITKSDKFKGFDSVDRIAQKWQLENAWKALKAHPMFGDAARGEKAAEKKG
jgi:hypothetical protein